MCVFQRSARPLSVYRPTGTADVCAAMKTGRLNVVIDVEFLTCGSHDDEGRKHLAASMARLAWLFAHGTGDGGKSWWYRLVDTRCADVRSMQALIARTLRRRGDFVGERLRERHLGV